MLFAIVSQPGGCETPNHICPSYHHLYRITEDEINTERVRDREREQETESESKRQRARLRQQEQENERERE